MSEHQDSAIEAIDARRDRLAAEHLAARREERRQAESDRRKHNYMPNGALDRRLGDRRNLGNRGVLGLVDPLVAYDPVQDLSDLKALLEQAKRACDADNLDNALDKIREAQRVLARLSQR